VLTGDAADFSDPFERAPLFAMSTEITFTREEVSTYYAVRVPKLKAQRAGEWRGPCPIHGGKDDNFAVDPATGCWFCHSTCGRGGDILTLEEALTGGAFPSRKAEVFRLVGRIEPEYRHSGTHTNGNAAATAPTKPTKSTNTASGWREMARHPYVDRDGNLLFEVVRFLKPDGTKTFIQVRPSGVEAAGTTDPERTGGVEAGGIVVGLEAGKYLPDPKAARARGKPTWKRAEDDTDCDGAEYHFRDCPRIPYRLPRVLNSDTVYLPEGEKDVHTLEGWGLVASCNPGGSGSSRLYAGWAGYFRGRHIVILLDNDGPGRKHAAAVAAALLSVAASVRIVELPGLSAKGDVTDWRDAGGTFEQFRELEEASKPMDAAALSELCVRWGMVDEDKHQQAARAEAGSLVTRRLSDINAKAVNWLWPGRIARGKTTIVAGNPGLGKSQITASIAAVVTTGGRWPVDRTQCGLGDVLFLTAEDDPADTLRPRLEAAGADLARVHVVDGVIRGYTGDGARKDRMFSLEEDLQALEAKLAELGNVAAVVIDPITAYLGDTDSHRNAEVRALLAPLSELAAHHNVSIIGVSHMSKAAGMQALMRVNGSMAFVAAARAAYFVGSDPTDKTRRLFLPMKNNLGPDSTGLAFRIEGATVDSTAGPLETSRVAWESEAVTLTADEAMQAETTPQDTSALAEAIDWLRETLAEGPKPASEIFKLASANGISKGTLNRAKSELGIKPAKAGMGGGWTWSLPPKILKLPEDTQEKNVTTFGDLEHLRDSREVEVEL
jgi:putative DNA primase/helicase